MDGNLTRVTCWSYKRVIPEQSTIIASLIKMCVTDYTRCSNEGILYHALIASTITVKEFSRASTDSLKHDQMGRLQNAQLNSDTWRQGFTISASTTNTLCFQIFFSTCDFSICIYICQAESILYPQIVNCRRLLYQNSVYGQGCNGDASFVASGFLLYCSSVSDI